jgi:hypothetical protein
VHALFTRLLLLPLLSPLLAVLLIAAVNPRPWVTLRLLTWTSPAWPLGGWLATGLAVGAGLSAAGTALALQGQPATLQPRRQVRRGGDGPEPRASSAPPPPRSESRSESRSAPWAGPSRSASDPPPTVSVPFRVIRRAKAATATANRAPATAAQAAPAPAADDWNSPDQDDW